MNIILLAEAGRAAGEAPPFQVAGKAYQTSMSPVVNTAAQTAPATATPSSDAVANSILGSTMSGYFEMIGYLLLILAGVWLLLWLLRRSGVGMFSPARQVMALESRLSLGPKKWVVVARVHGKRLVLGVTDHTISMLTELPEADPLGLKPAKRKPRSGAVAQSAKGMLQKLASPVQKGESADVRSTDDFEKFYAAAKEHKQAEQ